jgi:hypothetical protein
MKKRSFMTSDIHFVERKTNHSSPGTTRQGHSSNQNGRSCWCTSCVSLPHFVLIWIKMPVPVAHEVGESADSVLMPNAAEEFESCL